jgi:acetoacetate decarboxylase
MAEELGNSYPVAPWSLTGDAFQTMSFVRDESARAVVPSGLDFVFRAGGIYFGRYKAGSSLEYNELIVIQGLVRSSGKYGFWISQIYVDHPAALAGGHDIWDLPKQLAEFEVDADDRQRTARVRVSRAGTTLCALRVRRKNWGWSQRLTWPLLAGDRC